MTHNYHSPGVPWLLTTGCSTYRETKCHSVDRLLKRPWELMLPYRLEHHVLQILELIGHPSRPIRIDNLGRWRISAHSWTDFGVRHFMGHGPWRGGLCCCAVFITNFPERESETLKCVREMHTETTCRNKLISQTNTRRGLWSWGPSLVSMWTDDLGRCREEPCIKPANANVINSLTRHVYKQWLTAIGSLGG